MKRESADLVIGDVLGEHGVAEAEHSVVMLTVQIENAQEVVADVSDHLDL